MRSLGYRAVAAGVRHTGWFPAQRNRAVAYRPARCVDQIDADFPGPWDAQIWPSFVHDWTVTLASTKPIDTALYRDGRAQ